MPGRPTALHRVGQGPAVLAAGAGRVSCFFVVVVVVVVCFIIIIIISSRLSYLPFLMPHLLETAGYTEMLWSRPL